MRSVASLGAVATLLVVGTACGGISEKKLYDKLYTQSCKAAFECDEANATTQWGDVKGCEDAFFEEVELATDYYRPCDYSPKDAKKYLKAVKKLECDSPEADVVAADALWNAVYLCPGGGEPTPTPGDTGTLTP